MGCYCVVPNAKTGKPRAEAVRPPSPAGTIVSVQPDGKYGFIAQDSGEDDLFVMPKACEAFGQQIPEAGTRVKYMVVPNLKTGKPRAESVRPECSTLQPLSSTAQPLAIT